MHVHALFVLLACALYGLANVIFRGELSRAHSMLVIFIMNCVMIVCSGTLLLIAWRAGELETMPKDLWRWWWVGALVAGLCFFWGDYLCIRAYALGATVATVTILLMAIPLFAGVMEGVWRLRLPTRNELIALTLMVAVVLLIVFDPAKKPPPPPQGP